MPKRKQVKVEGDDGDGAGAADGYRFGGSVKVKDTALGNLFAQPSAPSARLTQLPSDADAAGGRAKRKGKGAEKMSGKKRKLMDDEDRDVVFASSKSDTERNKRTVFVGNLPAKTKSKAVNKLFSEYGKIESIRFRSLSMSKIDDHEGTVSRSQLIKTRQAQADSAQSAINAYVVFETNDAAQAALARNGHILQERHLRVDIAANAKQHDNTVSIFVGNLVLDVTDEELWDFFGDCGDVSSVRVIRDPLTGVGKGIAFVKFAERGAVTTAVEKSGIHLRGRAVRVSRATADASERGGGKKTKGGKSRTPAAASPKPSSPKINPRKRDGEGNKRRWSREGKPEPSPVTTRIAAVKTSKAGKSASKRDATGKKKRWRDRDGSQSDETGADMTGGFSGLKAIPGVLPDWVESAKSGKAGGKAGGRSEAKKKASVKAHKKELRDSKKVKSASKKAKAAEKAEGKSGSESKKGKKAKATSRSIY